MNKSKKTSKPSKNRKNRSVSFIMAIILFLVVHNLAVFIQNYISEDMMNYIYERSIGFDYLHISEQEEKVVSFLESREEVQGYSLYENWAATMEGGELCTISEYLNSVIEPYMDRKMETLNDDQCVIARYFYDAENNLIDMSGYVGKNITFYVDYYTWRAAVGLEEHEEGAASYTCYVVDVFDNKKAGEHNMIYVSHDKIDEIQREGEGIQEGDEKIGEFLERGKTSRCRAVLKKYEDIDQFYNDFSEILNEGSEVEIEFTDGIIRTIKCPLCIIKRNNEFESVREMLNIFIMFAYMISGTILAIMAVNYIYKTKEEIRNDYIEIGILKAVGYQNKDIAKKILQEHTIVLVKILLFSFTIGVFCFYIFVWGLKKTGDTFQNITFFPKISVFAVDYIIIILAFFIGFLVEMRRVKKANPSQILKSV